MVGVVNDDPVTLPDHRVDVDALLGEGAEIDLHQFAEPFAAGRDAWDLGVDDEVVGRQRHHPVDIVGVDSIEQTNSLSSRSSWLLFLDERSETTGGA
jgi:hypothetical protein